MRGEEQRRTAALPVMQVADRIVLVARQTGRGQNLVVAAHRQHRAGRRADRMEAAIDVPTPKHRRRLQQGIRHGNRCDHIGRTHRRELPPFLLPLPIELDVARRARARGHRVATQLPREPRLAVAGGADELGDDNAREATSVHDPQAVHRVGAALEAYA